MPETPDTDYFGFTRVGEGEQLSKNGFAALDLDRVTLDDLLHALTEHQHDAAPRLADPAGAPSLIPRSTGGTLPPNTTLYYRISYLDKWGLETAGSAESSVSTAGALNAPQAPAINIEITGGTLTPGLYAYVASYATASGGESITGPRTEVRITDGTANRLRIDLPDLVAGATSVRIYRSRPGQTQYYFLFETDQDFYYDDGITEDSTVTIPGFNSTNSANSVEVTVPGGSLPDGVAGWRLYRSVTPGNYSGFNLVHTVVEGSTETSNDVRVLWVDTGDALQRGEPREVSATVGGGRVVTLNQISGRFPLVATPRGARSWCTYITTPTLGSEYNRINAPYPVSPTAISAYFQDPPTTTSTGSQVAIRLTDNTGAYLDMVTDGTNGPYYVTTFPLTDGGSFEAELGTRSVNGVVPIVTDAAASNGQAVELNDVDEFVEYDLGILDRGAYLAYTKLRVTSSAPPLADLVVNVFSGSTSLVQQSFQATTGTYYELPGVPFDAPGGTHIKIRLTKGTGDPATYLVDQFRYAAKLTALAAGVISLSVNVGDLAGSTYPVPTRPTNPHWYFTEGVKFLTPAANSASAIATRSDATTADTFTVTSDQTWLTITPTSGTSATANLGFVADFNSLNPGDRSVATVSIQDAGHLVGRIKVVALKPPVDYGAAVNVTVQY